MPDHTTPAAEAPKRRRGGQPGNLNALKYGEHSPRLRVGFSAFPRQTRIIIAAAIWVAYRHQLEAHPPPRSARTRRKAHRQALQQLHDCFNTLDRNRNLTHRDILRSLRPMFEPEIAAREARQGHPSPPPTPLLTPTPPRPPGEGAGG